MIDNCQQSPRSMSIHQVCSSSSSETIHFPLRSLHPPPDFRTKFVLEKRELPRGIRHRLAWKRTHAVSGVSFSLWVRVGPLFMLCNVLGNRILRPLRVIADLEPGSQSHLTMAGDHFLVFDCGMLFIISFRDPVKKGRRLIEDFSALGGQVDGLLLRAASATVGVEIAWKVLL